MRIASPEHRAVQLALADLLKSNFSVHLVDDSDMEKKFQHLPDQFDHIVSLSTDIPVLNGGRLKGFSYFKICRVFDKEGNQVGWFIPAVSKEFLRLSQISESSAIAWAGESRCIVDTDIATGSTKAAAHQLFPGAHFFAPLRLESHQDLIDIEDLLFSKSILLNSSGEFENVSYLTNPLFFEKRTSVPAHFFEPVRKILRSTAAAPHKVVFDRTRSKK